MLYLFAFPQFRTQNRYALLLELLSSGNIYAWRPGF